MLSRSNKAVGPCRVDFHSHILPHFDDGAKDLQTSTLMVSLLSQQGIKTVFATPHFYAHKTDINDYLLRRGKKLEVLRQAVSDIDITVLCGSEVHIERDLSKLAGVGQLAMGGTGYILLEIPFSGYHDWMAEEIYNICEVTGLKPMIAHLDRYCMEMKQDQINDILSLDDVIIQINNDAFTDRHRAKFALDLIKEEYPIVFGCDTHNLEYRPPNYDICNRFLTAKLKGAEIGRLLNLHDSLITKGMG